MMYDTTLSEVEKDILLCEEYLAQTGELDGARRQRQSRIQPAVTQGTSSSSDERRKEIIAKLTAERAEKTAAILEQKSSEPAKQAKETREEIIARLVREKEERDAKKSGLNVHQRFQQANDAATEEKAVSQQSEGTKADVGPTVGRPRATEDLEEEFRRHRESRARSPDSLDGDDQHASYRGGSSKSHGAAAMTARPSSAPRQRRAPSPGPAQRSARGVPSSPATSRAPTSDVPTSSSKLRPSSAPRERPAGANVTKPVEFQLSTQQRSSRREDLKRSLEDNQKEVFTFQPKSSHSRRDDSPSVRASFEQRLSTLAKSKAEAWQEREKLRLQKEEQEQKECTFKPTIKRSQSPARGIGAGGVGGQTGSWLPVEERLLHEADHKQALRERAKRHLEEQEFHKNCTFRPKINDPTGFLDVGSYRPLHERVGELQRRKSESLQQLRTSQEEAASCTFQPQLNEHSVRLASQKSHDEMDVVERLHREVSFGVERKLAKQEQWENEMKSEHTFQPTLDPNSNRILQESDRLRGLSFEERQQAILERKAARVSMGIESVKSECSFQPDIGKSSDVILASRPAVSNGETFLERVERLAFKDSERQKALREGISEQYYSQFTFKPQINTVSKVVGRATPLDELYLNSATERKKREAAELAAQAAAEQCTFKPDLALSKKSAASKAVHNTINMKDPAAIMLTIQERERQKRSKIDHVKKSLEVKELEECTFSPAIVRKTGSQGKGGPVVIRGLGRRLELKELAKRKEEEHKERSEKVFLENVAPGARQPYTIPEPFKLRTEAGRTSERHELLMSQIEAERAAECTFHPKINESSTREILRQIIGKSF